LTPAGYASGHVCHTGQLYFVEERSRHRRRAPYKPNTRWPRTTLETDRRYRGGGAVTACHLSYRANAIERGVRGSLTMGVDPALRADAYADGPTAS